MRERWRFKKKGSTKSSSRWLVVRVQTVPSGSKIVDAPSKNWATGQALSSTETSTGLQWVFVSVGDIILMYVFFDIYRDKYVLGAKTFYEEEAWSGDLKF